MIQRKCLLFISLSVLSLTSSSIYGNKLQLADYKEATEHFTNPAIYDLSELYESEIFKNATPETQVELAQKQLKDQKWKPFKLNMRNMLIIYIARTLTMPIVSFAFPTLINYMASSFFDWYMEVDFSSTQAIDSVKEFRKQSGEKIARIFLMFSNSLNFISALANSSSTIRSLSSILKLRFNSKREADNAINKVMGTLSQKTKNQMILLDQKIESYEPWYNASEYRVQMAENHKYGAEVWYRAFNENIKDGLTPLVSKAFFILFCYLIIDRNPLPEGWMGRIAFFLEPRIFVGWTYMKWLKEIFTPKIYNPYQVVIQNNLPVDTQEPAQLAYIGKKYFMLSNPGLIKCLESKLCDAYLQTDSTIKTREYVQNGIALFFATKPVPLNERGIADKKELITIIQNRLKRYEKNLVSRFKISVFNYQNGTPLNPILIYGDSGSGKNYLCEQLPYFIGGNFCLVKTKGVSVSDFEGTEDQMGTFEKSLIKASNYGEKAVTVGVIDELDKRLRGPQGEEFSEFFLEFFDTNNQGKFYSQYYKTYFYLPPFMIFTANFVDREDFNKLSEEEKKHILNNKSEWKKLLFRHPHLLSRVSRVKQKKYSKKSLKGILYEDGKLKDICTACKVEMSKLSKEHHEVIQALIEKYSDMRELQEAIKYYLTDQQMLGRL